jgi:hypothetical protein
VTSPGGRRRARTSPRELVVKTAETVKFVKLMVIQNLVPVLVICPAVTVHGISHDAHHSGQAHHQQYRRERSG